MKVAVLAAGGVAPGMNAALRAVAQEAFSRGWEVMGIEGGYGGSWRAVSDRWIASIWWG